MHSSTVTQKGQVTIPSEIRQLLDLHTGDKVGFIVEDDHVILIRKHSQITAAFGLCQPKKSANSNDIKEAIRKRGKHESD